MAFEIYDTETMLGIVNEKKAQLPPSFFLSRFFPDVAMFDTETINFDLVSESEVLAPFVSPVVQGKVMADRGYSTKMFAPAYVKPKHVVDPSKVIKRRAGEAIGGDMSQDSRYRMAVEGNIAEEVRSIQRRLEVMAAQSIIAGKVTVAGDNYPVTEVNFGRAAGQTVTLAAGAYWTVAGADIIGSIDDMVEQTDELSGYAPDTLIVSNAVWKVMRANAEIRALLDIRRGGQGIDLDLGITMREQGVQYKGMIGSIAVFTHSGTYQETEGGAKTKLIANNQIVLASSGVEGVRCFGAIMDGDAGYRSSETFSKMWLNQDPSVTYTMTQSAPLMVPRRANASLSATVMA